MKVADGIMGRFVSALLLMAAPSFSQAQVLPDSHGVPSRLSTPPLRQAINTDDSMIAFSDMIGCMVAHNAKAARELLAAQAGSSESNSAMKKLLGRSDESSCLVQAGRLEMSSAMIRAAAAEALIRFDDRAGRIKVASILAGPLQPLDGLDGNYAFGDCLVVAQPRLATGLVPGTRAGWPEEMKMIDALRPAMADCLPAKQDFHLSRPMIRYSVALALYHRLEGASPNASSSGTAGRP